MKCKLFLLSKQQVAGPLDRLGDAALLLGGEAGILARENLPGVGRILLKRLRRGEGNLLRSEAALGFF